MNKLLVLANFITCLPPEIPRDIAFILGIIKHVQRWRESWKKVYYRLNRLTKTRAKLLFCQFISTAFLPFSLPSTSSLLKLPNFWSSTPLNFPTCIGVRASLVQHCKCRRAGWVSAQRCRFICTQLFAWRVSKKECHSSKLFDVCQCEFPKVKPW